MPGANLTREEAAHRAGLLEVQEQEVRLDLTCSETHFGTEVIIRFGARPPGVDTFVDFLDGTVQELTLNGHDLDPAQHYDGARITLPQLASENTLAVRGTAPYMNTGEGLHRFVDPVDGQIYLYSQFEVSDCRRVFPVFEQPDLKARFTFVVTAPTAWQVISNQPTPAPHVLGARDVPGFAEPVEVGRWSFPQTPVLPCYVTALVAGPYDVVRDEVLVRSGRRVPLGVFCRRSLTPYLDADNVLDCTKRGFAFFEREFDVDFPFDKYDQLFTPEYNMGAMENAGAVTLNETYVFRAKVPEALVERRALTILHELAHMWFGDLVTMHWWDDLWLNESFAEWASTTCQAEATQWTHAWTTFSIAEKAWAYAQDQLSSTHPIVSDIRHLEDVHVNFDGITYAKGASVLKQLVAYVGRDAFTAGLRAYFARHAWGNTTLVDLLTELERTSGRDLAAWSRTWLQTAGVNTLRAGVEVDDEDTITAAWIEQTAPEDHPTLRPHRLGIGLYDLNGPVLSRRHLVETDVAGPRTDIPELVGMRRPDLLLVNDLDLAYTKIRLDERSLATARDHLATGADSLVRALVLGAAWDMTRDGETRAGDFVDLVLRTLPAINDSTMLRVLLGQVTTAATLYTAPGKRADTMARLRDGLAEATRAAAPGSDAQLQLLSAFAQAADDQASLTWLDDLLTEAATLDGLALDTEMRWTLLTALVAGGRRGEADIDAEQARDNTATGRERAARARAARPTAAAKFQAWQSVFDSDDLPNQMVEAVAQGLARVHDPVLLEPFVDRYLSAILGVWERRTHAIAEAVVEGFYPLRLADQSLLERTTAWLSSHPNAPEGLVRLVSEARDRVVRALAAQARDAEP